MGDDDLDLLHVGQYRGMTTGVATSYRRTPASRSTRPTADLSEEFGYSGRRDHSPGGGGGRPHLLRPCRPEVRFDLGGEEFGAAPRVSSAGMSPIGIMIVIWPKPSSSRSSPMRLRTDSGPPTMTMPCSISWS
jgi:hypothetical protein